MFRIVLHQNNEHHVEASAYLNLVISHLRWSTDRVGVSLSWYIFFVYKYCCIYAYFYGLIKIKLSNNIGHFMSDMNIYVTTKGILI